MFNRFICTSLKGMSLQKKDHYITSLHWISKWYWIAFLGCIHAKR